MKPWYRSKTIWTAVVIGLLASANYLSQAVTDPAVLNGILIATALLQTGLRLLTDEGIKLS